MKPRNARVLVLAGVLLAAPLFEAGAQAPRHPRPQPHKPKPKEPQVIIKETPIEEGDPQQQDQTAQGTGMPQDQTGAQQQGQGAAPQDPAMAQDPAAATAQDPSAAQPGAVPAGKVTPEQMGVSFAAPQGWQLVDPNTFTLPGDVCCAWKPGELASIVLFLQRPGRAFLPRVLLDETAKVFKNPPINAQVQRQEVVTLGGKRAFSLVVTAGGNGAAIDGKGTIPTTQHWIAIPREQDVVLFLMTTPAEKFDQNEQTFQAVLNSLQVGGTQTAEQQASQ